MSCTFVTLFDKAYTKDILLPAMRAISSNANITTEIIGEVIGLEPMPENAARDLLFQLTGQESGALVPFGTEAGLFQALGTSTVVCGPGSIEQAHKPDEFITRSELQNCLNMLRSLTQSLAV